jgi:hypothetical protein
MKKESKKLTRKRALSQKSQQALAKFFEAWEAKSYRKMYKLCQLTWSSIHPYSEFKTLFRYMELKSWAVESVKVNENVLMSSFRVKATIKYIENTSVIKEILRKFGISKTNTVNVDGTVREIKSVTVSGVLPKVNVIPEIEPYSPSIDGKFGVNPISVLNIERDA